jgi:hypothetical protein
MHKKKEGAIAGFGLEPGILEQELTGRDDMFANSSG